MENFELQFALASVINSLVYLIIFIASIILVLKKKSLSTILLLLGSILTGLGFIGSFIYNAFAAKNGIEYVMKAQIFTVFFNAFSFFIFGIGLLLLAINNSKKS